METTIYPSSGLRGETTVPGDKSLAHRALILGALAVGITKIRNFPASADCLATLHCLQELGVEISHDQDQVIIQGTGRLSPPKQILNAQNSGTTLRLLTGVLAAQPFASQITGDASLQKRPMGRLIRLLEPMGAKISGQFAPLKIAGQNLQGQALQTPVASAQIKSALLLAGLQAEGLTWVKEPSLSRNHTEIMLEQMGIKLIYSERGIGILGGQKLRPLELTLPGDLSAAAYWLVAASIVPNSALKLKDIGLNPTRTGIIEVLQQMGADLTIQNQHQENGELRGDLQVRSAPLKGIKIGGSLIPCLLDEIPILAVAAAVAQGETLITEAAELKVKETDRIAAIASELSQFGVKITSLPDGLRIQGDNRLQGCTCQSWGDHRIAMACAVAGLIASGSTILKNSQWIKISFPDFLAKLHYLCYN